jgi:hypothetical protein
MGNARNVNEQIAIRNIHFTSIIKLYRTIWLHKLIHISL